MLCLMQLDDNSIFLSSGSLRVRPVISHSGVVGGEGKRRGWERRGIETASSL